MRPIIVPYNMGSASARALKQKLVQYRAKRVRVNGNYRPYRNHLVINWGYSHRPAFLDNWVSGPPAVLNNFERVREASDKLLCFSLLNAVDVPVPDYTQHREVASQWLEEGCTVLARTRRGSHGRGIRIIEPGNNLPQASMYVKYVKKKDEYRVHVFRGRSIDVQRKMRSTTVPDDLLNWQIRNHDNGFVFGRGDVNPPLHVLENSINAIQAAGLDFGAVDIIYNQHYDYSCVLEINTAPGLEGTTLQRYTQAIRSIL